MSTIADSGKERVSAQYYDEVKRFFDRIASFCDLTEIFVSRTRKRIVKLVSITEDMEVLDVGTGTGRQISAFAREASVVSGIDFSQNMIRRAIKNNRQGNVGLIQADGGSLPLRSNQYDVSCLSLVLHHVPFVVRMKILKEVTRVTKPKGVILIFDYKIPTNRLARYVLSYPAARYDSKYYAEFVSLGLEVILQRLGIQIQQEVDELFGIARVLKCTNPMRRKT